MSMTSPGTGTDAVNERPASDSRRATLPGDTAATSGRAGCSAFEDDLPRDWRGSPVLSGCQVLFSRPWGRNKTSTEIVEAIVQGFTPTGMVRVKVIATSRESRWEGMPVYAAPRHSITVIAPPGAWLRPADMSAEKNSLPL